MFKMDLKRFKKIASNKDHTVMQHEDGHQITIAHKALSPKMVKQLSAIPLAEGGEVKKQIPGGPGSPAIDQKAAEEFSKGARGRGTTISEGVENVKKEYEKAKKSLGFADGGSVQDQQEKDKQAHTKESFASQFRGAFASDPLASPAPVQKKADGGPIEQAPLDIQPAQDSEVERPLDIQPVQEQTQKPLDIVPASPDMVQPAAMEAPAQEVSLPKEAAPIQPTMQQQSEMPSIESAYQKQLQGIQQESQAQAALGQKEAAVLDSAAAQAASIQRTFQNQIKMLEQERQAHMQDIKNNLINPEKYWDNHSKLAAGIGIILGGFNPTDRPNAAIEFLNHQIDRSVQAQAQNLQARNNLLAANLHQFGNMRDAVAMTKALMNDYVSDRLKAEAARMQDPMAKARALQMAGKLDQEITPAMMQIAMRQALIKAGEQQAQGQGMSASQQAEQMLPYLRQMNPEAAKELETRLVPGVGVASIPVAQGVRDNLVAKQQLNDMAQDFYKWAQKHGGTLMDRATVNEGKAKAAELQSMYRNAINGGVFKQGEQAFIDQIIDSDPTKFFNELRVLPKLKEVIHSNNRQMNILKQGYGLPITKVAEEPIVKTLNGVRYMKVPGGWQKVQ